MLTGWLILAPLGFAALAGGVLWERYLEGRA